MPGSKIRPVREQVLTALNAASSDGDFVWDGKDEDERPLTAVEMREGMALAKKRGRPVGTSKVSTTIRFDADVLEAFRSAGPGWQSRMNAVLRDWVERHPVGK